MIEWPDGEKRVDAYMKKRRDGVFGQEDDADAWMDRRRSDDGHEKV